MFFFQYLVQAGLFFVVPLYLSVCLGLSALATGVRLTAALASRCSSRRSGSRVSGRTSRPRLRRAAAACSCCSSGRSSCSAALDADAGAGDRLRAACC